MSIRTYQAGDEAAQVRVYNKAAADLPKFKPATVEETARRCQAHDFDPATRFYAESGGRVVGYAVFHPNGRVSYPWCCKGYESLAEPLLEAVLSAMRARGLSTAFAAYRADWPTQREFFLTHGFHVAREMVNFILDIVDMPTPGATPTVPLSPLRPDDAPAVLQMGRGVLRADSAAELARHLLQNPYFGPESLFVLRGRSGEAPVAVGLLVTAPAYANPKQLDAGMPCFRLGAFGTEGMQVKRINGLFSLLAPSDRDTMPLGLDLLGQAAFRLRDTDLGTFAAQVPSDAPHLLRFYQRVFHRQGAFPVFERAL